MLQWKWRTFAELSNIQLYDILQLRETIFTFEQAVTVVDIDGVDKQALHCFAYDDEQSERLAAYLRVYKHENKARAKSLGRIVVNPNIQGRGLGRKMMQECLRYLQENYPSDSIEMSAQYYLLTFYESLGFKTEGEIYDEASIEHINIVYHAS